MGTPGPVSPHTGTARGCRVGLVLPPPCPAGSSPHMGDDAGTRDEDGQSWAHPTGGAQAAPSPASVSHHSPRGAAGGSGSARPWPYHTQTAVGGGGCGCAVFAQDKVYGTARRGWGHRHPSLPRWQPSWRAAGGAGGRGEGGRVWGLGGTQDRGHQEGSWGRGDCVNQGRREVTGTMGTQSYGDQGGHGERGHGVLGTVGIRGTRSRGDRAGQHHREQCWGGNGRTHLWLCQRDPIPGHCRPLGTTVPLVPPAIGYRHPLGATVPSTSPSSGCQCGSRAIPSPSTRNPRGLPWAWLSLPHRCSHPLGAPVPRGPSALGGGGREHPAMTAAL